MIAINLIRQYHFCPRIVYFNLLTDIKPIFPRHVSLGQEFHNAQENLSKNRRFKKLHIDFNQVVNNLYLEDEELGILGIVDLALITNDEVVPIEYKNIKSKKYISSGHTLQLYGYGMLLAKKFNKNFNRALIIYGNNLKFYQIKITSKIRDEFLKTLNAIKDIQNSGVFPDSSANEAKCLQCEYLNFCDDRI